jgi:hypothetical protein
MITRKQRILYLDLARRAFERAFDPDDLARTDSVSSVFSVVSPPSLADWRRAECRYATGGRSMSDGLSNDQLSRALSNFRCWISSGRRATAEELDLAMGRRRVEGLRDLWDAVNSRVRSKVMRERFGIALLEEIEPMPRDRQNQVRWTLMRLARDYPAQQRMKEEV